VGDEESRKGQTMEVVFKDESYRIMGACFEVYKEKGCGFSEGFIRSVWRLNLNCNHCRSKRSENSH
jgi:hypothetical protein